MEFYYISHNINYSFTLFSRWKYFNKFHHINKVLLRISPYILKSHCLVTTPSLLPVALKLPEDIYCGNGGHLDSESYIPPETVWLDTVTL